MSEDNRKNQKELSNIITSTINIYKCKIKQMKMSLKTKERTIIGSFITLIVYMSLYKQVDGCSSSSSNLNEDNTRKGRRHTGNDL